MKLINKILLFVNIILCIFSLLAYISPFANPNDFWPLSFFGLAYPYLLLFNLLFILMWMLKGNRNAYISVVTVLLGFHYIRETIVWNKPVDKQETGITVMSYNLNQGYYLYDKKIPKGQLKNYLIKDNPDICLLQEFETDYILEEISGLKSYVYKLKIKNVGTCIYSKFPFIKKGYIDFDIPTNSCIWGDFKIGKDTVRIYSVHFKSNQVSKQAEDIVAEIEKQNKIETKSIKSILRSYKHNVQIRAKQVLRVKEHILKSPYPVIIGGDFNDPPVSFTYREFNDFLQDAFKEKGLGFGFTYQGVIPFLRIDYLMISPGIEILEFDTGSKKYSDHYPIKAIIKI